MGVEPELYQPEAGVEEEPRYLRRQKPVEIRRHKFGKRTWKLYARVLLGLAAAAAGGWLGYETSQFFLYSPRFVLTEPGQILVQGHRHVSREAVLEQFIPDRGQSVFRVPLAERRRQLEELPWVEQASVRRVLPNRLEVEIVERRPVAYLRMATELALIDASGVILERPLEGEFRFPVVTGLGEPMAQPERERRMKLYLDFLKQVDLARPGGVGQVSEVDLADADDLRATVAGMAELGDPAANGQGAVLVHFGSGDFLSKYRVFVEHIGGWRASAGRVESVDLRFERQVVVNPEPRPTPMNAGPGSAASAQNFQAGKAQ